MGRHKGEQFTPELIWLLRAIERGLREKRRSIASRRSFDFAQDDTKKRGFARDDTENWMRRLGTGTGFAGAKLSEVLPLRERCSLRSG
jgi:hypothetical protein